MNKTVLITGGSGLIGKPLTKALLEKGYGVHHLSRSKNSKIEGVKNFQWDIHSGKIDPGCIENVESVIHLSGEGIASKPWTQKQKKELINSRVKSIQLIYKLIRETPQAAVKEVISASGVGFYGDRADELLTETSIPGTDFLAHICIEWENAVDEIANQSIRLVKLRTGVVLSPEGGALAKMDKPIKTGFGAVLGSGKQWMPWIHIDDMVALYLYALENKSINGTFNAASPQPETNQAFTTCLAKVLGKRILLPAVPPLILRIILGEMCAVVLNSTKTSAEKIIDTGFKFTFTDLESALTNIYGQTTTS